MCSSIDAIRLSCNQPGFVLPLLKYKKVPVAAKVKVTAAPSRAAQGSRSTQSLNPGPIVTKKPGQVALVIPIIFESVLDVTVTEEARRLSCVGIYCGNSMKHSQRCKYMGQSFDRNLFLTELDREARLIVLLE